jgi:thiopeptide-type bacteriocin biosynthesis protein
VPGEPIIEAADFFLLRTPALPRSLQKTLRDEYDRGIAPSRSALLRDPLVREALFLASSNLSARLDREDSGADARLDLAAARYLYRMLARPTPYGMFAGVTLGRAGDDFDLQVCDSEQAARVCRIDQSVISDLQLELCGEGAIEYLRGTSLILNDSLWRAPDGFRYVELARDGGAAQYKLSRMRATAALERVVDRLAAGAVPFADLSRELAEAFGTAHDAAEGFVVKLVREQVLVSLPRIAVTGDDAVGGFAAALADNPHASGIAGTILGAVRTLARAGSSAARNIELYRDAIAQLRTLGIELDDARTVQVDMHKSGTNPQIPAAAVDVLLSQLWALRALLNEKGNAALRDFASAFADRYGDTTVPLLEALDSEFGVGFGTTSKPATPLVDGISGGGRAVPELRFGAVDRMLLERLEAALLAGAREIVLEDDDLAAVTEDTDDLPSSFCVLGAFGEATDGSRVFNMTGISGVPAMALFGRFCCGSFALAARVRDFIETSEADTDDVIVAEIVHLPDGHVGNVMLRPVLRRHEIVYMGSSGAEPQRRIAAADLQLCVRGGEIVLSSKRLGKRIIPRSTTAHAFMDRQNLPVYRFLGLLQAQNEGSVRPAWGALSGKLPFLPGIRYRDIRLALPRWQFDAEETKRVAKARGDGREPISHLLKNGTVAQRVRLQQGDNFLDLDLGESLDRALLIEECRRNETITLDELPPEDTDLATDTRGRRFSHEIAIPVFRRHPAELLRARATQADEAAAAMPPGSEWLYARIFCGYSAMDRLIADLLPQLRAFSDAEGCRKLFFIRYDEGGQHLRLRLQGDPDTVWGAVRRELEALLAPWLGTREVARFEYATYLPEAERYGGPAALACCEHVFAADSAMVSRALPAILKTSSPEQARWQFALASMLGLMKSFAFEPSAELGVLESMLEAYRREFALPRTDRDALNDKYRAHRTTLDAIVRGEKHADAAVEAALRERDADAAPHLARIASLVPPTRLTAIAQSLLHMAANRILPERARLHELVLLRFTLKSRLSMQGREKFAAKMHVSAAAELERTP